MAEGARRVAVGGVCLLVVVIALVAMALVLVGRESDGGPTQSAIRQEGSATGGTVRAATVQEGRARTVAIERADLPAAGYVAVYASADGAPSRLLGTTDRLTAGRHDDVRVTLQRRLRRRTDVVAVIHTEDGVTAGLDFPDGDPPFTDDAGSVVALPISVAPD